MLIVAPLLLAASWRVRRPRSWRARPRSGLLPALAWTAFAVVYYGFPFPNTAYAKLGMDISRAQLWKQGVIYFIDSVDRDPLTLVLIGFAIVMAAGERARGAPARWRRGSRSTSSTSRRSAATSCRGGSSPCRSSPPC